MNIGNERLLKLATHLETGKLGHKVFDFGQYNDSILPQCGTAGCALGECPIVFPDEWEFGDFGTLILRPFQYGGRSGAVCFFELNQAEVERLFFPKTISCSGHSVLPVDATREQVAAGIRAFVEGRSE